jgi:7-carboxy-7-deazaguanine synthase (Cx14CxxC type)
MNVGRPAVFCRFAGCNLWSGREQDRQTAICQFCDTDFIGTDGSGGGKFALASDLAQAVLSHWPEPALVPGQPFVVCTGGEPLLQLDEPLVHALHALGFEIAIETNGTVIPPAGIDWLCVSPKANAELQLRTGHELKLIFPQAGAAPERFESLDFQHFLLQPMDGPERTRNTQLAIQYCLTHPRWRLSVQTHKFLGIR